MSRLITNYVKILKMLYADTDSCYSFVSVAYLIIVLVITKIIIKRKETTLMKQGNNESIIPVTITSTLNTIWAIGTSIKMKTETVTSCIKNRQRT